MLLIVNLGFGPSVLPRIASAENSISLPAPGVLVDRTVEYRPLVIKGLTIHPEKPFYFDFLLDKGQFQADDDEFRNESLRLIKYFLASLTVPEEDLWVNLSPQEAERIIPEEFAVTDMGRDLLMQDYLLKQFTASLMFPDDRTGKAFWTRVHRLAQQRFGTTDIPVNTFNKVWIVPREAVVYQQGNSAYVVRSSLKVMMEEDYIAREAQNSPKSENIDHFADDLIREILLPEIEREVNHGKQFARLRQVYHALILATWYKENVRASFVNQMYSNRNKVQGIDIQDKDSEEKIYAAYMDAFRRGVYNIIREDYDPYSRRTIPRNYFSGGMNIKPVVTIIDSLETMGETGDMALMATKFDLMAGGQLVSVDAPDQEADQATLAEIITDQHSGRIRFRGPIIRPAFVFFGIRHGETDANARGIFQGSTDVDINQLNDKGLADAQRGALALYERVAPQLRRGEKVLVLTSALNRTKQTAQAFLDLVDEKYRSGDLGDILNLEIKEDPDLNEINFGALSNKDPAEYSDEEAAFVRSYRQGKNALRPAPGGESYLDLLARGKAWLEKMNRLYGQKPVNVIVFGHGTFLSTLQILTGIKNMTDGSGYIDWISNRPGNGEVVAFREDEAMMISPDVENDVITKDLDRATGRSAEIGKFFIYYRPLPPGLATGIHAQDGDLDGAVAQAIQRGKQVISLADYTYFNNRPVYESLDRNEEPAQIWDHTQAAVAALQEVDMNGKTVVDLGAGDGILSVLALRMGAKKVVAVDGMNTAGLIEMNIGENEPHAGDFANRWTFRQAMLDTDGGSGTPALNARFVADGDVVVMNVPTRIRDQILTMLSDPRFGVDISRVQTMIVAGSFEDDPVGEFATAGQQKLLSRLGFRVQRKVRVPRQEGFVTAFVLQRVSANAERQPRPKHTQTLTYDQRHRSAEVYLNDVMAAEFEQDHIPFNRFVEVGLGDQSNGRWAPTFFNWFQRLQTLKRRHPAISSIDLLGLDQEPFVIRGVQDYFHKTRSVRLGPDDNIDFEIGDFDSLRRMPSGSVDIVRVMNVFTHYPSVEDHQDFYAAVEHVLREGGLFQRVDNGVGTLWKKINGQLRPQELLVEPGFLLNQFESGDIRHFPAEVLYRGDERLKLAFERIRLALNKASANARAKANAMDLRSLVMDKSTINYRNFLNEMRQTLTPHLASGLRVGADGFVSLTLLPQVDRAMLGDSDYLDPHAQLIRESRINTSSRWYSFEDRLDDLDHYLGERPESLSGTIVVVGFGEKSEQLTAVATRYPNAEVIGIERNGDSVAEVQAEIDELDDDNLARRIRIFEADARDLSQLLQDDSVAMVIYPKSLDYFELANLMNGGRNAQALVHAMLSEARRILLPGGTFVATGSPLDITHRYLQSSSFFDIRIDTYDEEGIYATKSGDNAVLGDDDQAMLADANVIEISEAIIQKARSGQDNLEQELYTINRLIQRGDLTPEDYDKLIGSLMNEPGPLTGWHVPTVVDTLNALNMLSVSAGTTYRQKLRIYDVLNLAGRHLHLRAVKSYSERINAIRENVKAYFEDHFEEIVEGVGDESVDYEVLEFLADPFYRQLQDYLRNYWNDRTASGGGRLRPQEGPMYTARRERRRLLNAFQELIDTGRVTSEDLDYMIDFLLGYRGPLNDPIRENALGALDILKGLGTSAITDDGQKREIHLALVQEDSFAKTGHIRHQIAAAAQAIEVALDDSEPLPVDAALTVEENPGGIDFTANHLTIKLLRDEVGRPVPWDQQPIFHVPIDGMVPVILNIQPVTNLPLLIGARESAGEVPLTPSAPARDELGRKEREDIFDRVKPAVL